MLCVCAFACVVAHFVLVAHALALGASSPSLLARSPLADPWHVQYLSPHPTAPTPSPRSTRPRHPHPPPTQPSSPSSFPGALRQDSLGALVFDRQAFVRSEGDKEVCVREVLGGAGASRSSRAGRAVLLPSDALTSIRLSLSTVSLSFDLLASLSLADGASPPPLVPRSPLAALTPLPRPQPPARPSTSRPAARRRSTRRAPSTSRRATSSARSLRSGGARARAAPRREGGASGRGRSGRRAGAVRRALSPIIDCALARGVRADFLQPLRARSRDESDGGPSLGPGHARARRPRRRAHQRRQRQRARASDIAALCVPALAAHASRSSTDLASRRPQDKALLDSATDTSCLSCPTLSFVSLVQFILCAPRRSAR